MSAFIESADVINTIARALKNNELGVSVKAPKTVNTEHPDDIANKLYEINVKSVNARYGEDTSTYYGNYINPKAVSAMQIFKYMESWLYQSCESEECRNSPIYNWVKNVAKEYNESYKAAHGANAYKTYEYMKCMWS